MQCGQCKQPLDIGAEFCGNCGTKVAKTVSNPVNSRPVESGPILATNTDVKTTVTTLGTPAVQTETQQDQSFRPAEVVESAQPAATSATVQVPTSEQSNTANPYAAAPVAPSATNGMAVAALIVGIIGFMTGIFIIGILLDIVAIVLGIIALKKQGGHGMAIAGIVVAAIGLLLTLILLPTTFKEIQKQSLESRQNSYNSTNSVNE